jgi:hypothetical protein
MDAAVQTRAYKKYLYAGSLARWRPHGVLRLLAWRPPANTPSSYCMLYAVTGLVHGPSNNTTARMSLPRAANCDLQGQGIAPVIAGRLV